MRDGDGQKNGLGREEEEEKKKKKMKEKRWSALVKRAIEETIKSCASRVLL